MIGLACFGVVALALLVRTQFVSSQVTPTALPIQPSSPVESPAAMSNDRLVLELFNPSDRSLTHQITKTTLTKHIEQALTVSFILSKCNLISETEYRDSFRALIVYAQQSQLAENRAAAEATVRQIGEAASASYSLVYSRLSCANGQLPALASQLKTWREQLM
jgi:hypothetical protein